MEANGSPKLVFSPNNDTDDYTLAVAYVNKEFARIQKGEEVKRTKVKKVPRKRNCQGCNSRSHGKHTL